MREAGALIVAAGRSVRMGDFKPLMEFKGETVIRRVVRSLKEAGASPIFLVTGYRGEDLRAHLTGEDIRFVENPDYAATQMFDSVKLGLEDIKFYIYFYIYFSTWHYCKVLKWYIIIYFYYAIFTYTFTFYFIVHR